MIYLDNNATTMMHTAAIEKLAFWCNRGNPSSGYASAKAARGMLEDLKILTGKLAGVKTCCKEPRDGGNKNKQLDPALYKVILCSGASEANSMAIAGIIYAYRKAKKCLPHVIASAIEHKSILLLLSRYESDGEISLTLVKPTPTGHIKPSDIQKELLPNTCLICVMHANNETGAINDISNIAKIAHDANIAFHSDTVQSFGKVAFDASNIDSFAISYHKLGGPPGVGALCIKQALLIGYKLPPLIYGTQNEHLRGGTENLPGFGAALEALKITFSKHEAKILKMQQMKEFIMGELRKRIPCKLYKEYIQLNDFSGLVFMSNDSQYYLPNTILVSLVKQTGKDVCNVEIKNQLEAQGIIVSVGSACNTQSDKASHVLDAMDADKYIRKGTIRISLSPDNTLDECKTFIKEYLMILKKQLGK